MVTLLYHWNFTGSNDLSLGEEIYDANANLVAKVKRRGTYSSSNFSRSSEGIFLNNNDGENGGYYIDLEGLNTVQLGGNLSFEMVIQNYDRTIKSIYFTSIGEVSNNGEVINAAALTARFNNATKFLVRPDQTDNITYSNYRNVNESSATVVTDNNEYHYIFSVHYDNSGSSLKIYINGDKKGENTADLEKAVINDARNTNFIGTRKVDGEGATYLNGVIKYLKIYQNSISDEEVTSIYNNFNSSPYYSDISSGTNEDKFTRRHSDVNTFFTNNSSITSFQIFGNQLGLSNETQTYTVHKFISGNTIDVIANFNYIPLQGENNFIIFKQNTNYCKITQTSSESNENSLYKCELSIGNTDNFVLKCQNKGFNDTYEYENIKIIFGGLEFNINNVICFHEDTIINTDQGDIKIKNLKSHNTIQNNKILYLVKSKILHDNFVLIKKNAFGDSIPSNDITLTPTHLIVKDNNIVYANSLINNTTVLNIKNKIKSHVYNIILFNKNFITINNLQLNTFGINLDYYKYLNIMKQIGKQEITVEFGKKSFVTINLNKFENF